MGVDKLLNENAVLKYLKITIDDTEIVQDDIITFEINQNFDNFVITGNIKIKDTFDFNNNGLISLNGNNLIKIVMTDYHNTRSTRTYRIVNTTITPAQERHKVYNFDFVDEVSFILMNTYMSKSFSDTPINAFKLYIKELGIDTLLKGDNLITDIIESSTSTTFAVPQDVSVLEFFVDKFKEENIRIWQDRFGLHIRELVVANLEVNKNANDDDIVYSNQVTDNLYFYKIHDFDEVKNSTYFTNTETPISRTYRYNTDKMIVDTTLNLTDEIPNLKLNTLDASGLQLTNGEKYNTQSFYTVGNQRYELFDTYMKNNQLSIATIGSIKDSNIGTCVSVLMKGNIMSADAAMKGDVHSSGKYFIGGVTDRIIGDKLIHRLTLLRTDSKEPK